MKKSRLPVFQIGILLASIIVSAPSSGQGDDAARDRLRQHVQNYVSSADDKERSEILKQIEADKVDFKSLEAVCRTPWKFEKQQPGKRTGLKLQVAGQEEEYTIAVPENYSPDKPAPLLLALHGANGKGEGQLESWAPEATKRGCIVVAPTARTTWHDARGVSLALAAIREARKNFNIDPDRVCITGISMGGHGTWQITIRQPDVFAAACPIASGLLPNHKDALPSLLHTPVYIVHGSKDRRIPVENGRDASAALQELGYEVVYVEHDRTKPNGTGHMHPEWEVPNILDFFAAKKRNPNPETVKLYSVTGTGHQMFWVRLDERGRKGLAKIEAVRKGDAVTATAENVKRLTIFFPSAAKNVKIVVNDKTVFEGPVSESAEAILESARHDCGGGTLCKGMVTVDVP